MKLISIDYRSPFAIDVEGFYNKDPLACLGQAAVSIMVDEIEKPQTVEFNPFYSLGIIEDSIVLLRRTGHHQVVEFGPLAGNKSRYIFKPLRLVTKQGTGRAQPEFYYYQISDCVQDKTFFIALDSKPVLAQDSDKKTGLGFSLAELKKRSGVTSTHIEVINNYAGPYTLQQAALLQSVAGLLSKKVKDLGLSFNESTHYTRELGAIYA